MELFPILGKTAHRENWRTADKPSSKTNWYEAATGSKNCHYFRTMQIDLILNFPKNPRPEYIQRLNRKIVQCIKRKKNREIVQCWIAETEESRLRKKEEFL